MRNFETFAYFQNKLQISKFVRTKNTISPRVSLPLVEGHVTKYKFLSGLNLNLQFILKASESFEISHGEFSLIIVFHHPIAKNPSKQMINVLKAFCFFLYGKSKFQIEISKERMNQISPNLIFRLILGPSTTIQSRVIRSDTFFNFMESNLYIVVEGPKISLNFKFGEIWFIRSLEISI